MFRFDEISRLSRPKTLQIPFIELCRNSKLRVAGLRVICHRKINLIEFN